MQADMRIHNYSEITLPVWTRIIDLDGREGTIVKVTEWNGSVWYDVRFGPQGVAVRYRSDVAQIIHNA